MKIPTSYSETEASKIAEAELFANEKHSSQTYGKLPYSYHLEQVAKLAVRFEMPAEFVIAAFLHDSMEDAGVSKTEISSRFGESVADLVDAVTSFGTNRKARVAMAVAKLEAFPKAANLKMLDRLANAIHSKKSGNKLFDAYRNEHRLFKAAFEKGDASILAELESVLFNPESTSNQKPKI